MEISSLHQMKMKALFQFYSFISTLVLLYNQTRSHQVKKGGKNQLDRHLYHQ